MGKPIQYCKVKKKLLKSDFSHKNEKQNSTESKFHIKLLERRRGKKKSRITSL